MANQTNVLKWKTCNLDQPITFLRVYDSTINFNGDCQDQYILKDFERATSCFVQFIKTGCSKIVNDNVISSMSCGFKVTLKNENYIEESKENIKIFDNLNDLKFESDFGEFLYNKKNKSTDKISEVRTKGRIEITYYHLFEKEDVDFTSEEFLSNLAHEVFGIDNSSFDLSN